MNMNINEYKLEILPLKSKDEIFLQGYILKTEDGFDLSDIEMSDYIKSTINVQFNIDTIDYLSNISHSVRVISINTTGIYVELHNLETPIGKLFNKILLDFIESSEDIPIVIAKPNIIGHIENGTFKVAKLLSITLDIKLKDSI